MQAIQELLSNRVLISGLVGWGSGAGFEDDYLRAHAPYAGSDAHFRRRRYAERPFIRSAPWRPRREFIWAGFVSIRHQRDRGDYRHARRNGRPARNGQAGEALNEFIDLFAKLEQPLSDQEKLKELVGHTPLQVCMGGLLRHSDGRFVAISARKRCGGLDSAAGLRYNHFNFNQVTGRSNRKGAPIWLTRTRYAMRTGRLQPEKRRAPSDPPSSEHHVQIRERRRNGQALRS